MGSIHFSSVKSIIFPNYKCPRLSKPKVDSCKKPKVHLWHQSEKPWGSHWVPFCSLHFLSPHLDYHSKTSEVFNSCDDKAEFSESLLWNFSVTWSFRNQSKMIRWFALLGYSAQQEAGILDVGEESFWENGGGRKKYLLSSCWICAFIIDI